MRRLWFILWFWLLCCVKSCVFDEIWIKFRKTLFHSVFALLTKLDFKGAARNHDIIPWTVDVDVLVDVPQHEQKAFLNTTYAKMYEVTHKTLDSVDCDGDPHMPIPVARAVPACPVLLPKLSHGI